MPFPHDLRLCSGNQPFESLLIINVHSHFRCNANYFCYKFVFIIFMKCAVYKFNRLGNSDSGRAVVLEIALLRFYNIDLLIRYSSVSHANRLVWIHMNLVITMTASATRRSSGIPHSCETIFHVTYSTLYRFRFVRRFLWGDSSWISKSIFVMHLLPLRDDYREHIQRVLFIR